MGLPVAIAIGGISGIVKAGEAKRREQHITDRVAKYSGFSESQLQDIVKTYGGEMGEAAQRVLSSRGSSAQSTAPAATVVERLSGSGGQTTLLVIGGIVLLLVVMRGK